MIPQNRILKHVFTIILGLLLTSGASSATSVAIKDYFHPMVQGASWYYARQTERPRSVTSVRVRMENPEFNFVFKGDDHGLAMQQNRVVAQIAYSESRDRSGRIQNRRYRVRGRDYYGIGKKFSIYGSDNLQSSEYIRFAPGLEFPAIFKVGKPVKRSNDLLGTAYRPWGSMGWMIGPKITWKVLVVGKGAVTVPAGVFNDCIHVRFSVTTGNSVEEVVDEWWAKGVGRVRMKYTGIRKTLIVDDLAYYNIPAVAHIKVTDITAPSPFKPGKPFDFGPVTIGGPPSSRTFSVQNTGAATIYGLTASSADPAFRTGYILIPNLAPGESARFNVRFAPKKVRNFRGKLQFQTAEPVFRPYVLPITGRGVTPKG